MTRVSCPFCFQVHDFEASYECPNVGMEVPARFVRDYHNVPPLWLMAIGFSGHGKTSYLSALTLALENLSLVVDGMWYRPLDGHTLSAVRRMRDEVALGKIVEETPAEGRRPLIFHVHNIPQFDSRCLVLYDVAGQSYDSFSAVAQQAKAIKQVTTVWFLVSLQDLRESGGGRTLTDLFSTYLAGIEQLRVDIEGWNLIVVFTKADQEHFTPSLKGYLKTDPFKDLFSGELPDSASERPRFAHYPDNLGRISEELEVFTREKVRGGAAFVNMVRASGMNVVFTLCSALGQSPDLDRGYLRRPASPHRVLDPFLWALTLEAPKPSRPLCLVLDLRLLEEASDAAGIGLADRVWELMSEVGETTSYELGRVAALAAPGVQPSFVFVKRVPRVSLLGPILARMNPDARVLLLTSGPVLDLVDLLGTRWEKRMVWVIPGESASDDWPMALDGRGGPDRSARWVEKLMSL